jgi:methanogenic corrinoid protein MtbC1
MTRGLPDAAGAHTAAGAQAVLDRLLAATTVDAALRDVVIPYLEELGARWERGEASVAQEHFASSVLRGRLLGLARGWGLGIGPVSLLACLPGEQHDLGLIAFGLALRARGWRVVYLGQDAPIGTIADTARALEPDLVVVHAVTVIHVTGVANDLRELASEHRLALGGAAAAKCDTIEDVWALTGDPVAEAEHVTALVHGPARG